MTNREVTRKPDFRMGSNVLDNLNLEQFSPLVAGEVILETWSVLNVISRGTSTDIAPEVVRVQRLTQKMGQPGEDKSEVIFLSLIHI